MTQAGEVHSRKQSIAVPAAPVTQLTTSPITRGIPNVSDANIAAKVPAVDKMREADPNPRLQSRPESDFAQPRTPLKAVCNPSHKVDPEPSRILCRVVSGEKQDSSRESARSRFPCDTTSACSTVGPCGPRSVALTVRYLTHRAVVQGLARLHANCAAKRPGSKMFSNVWQCVQARAGI